jgi:hypothetical protein
MTDDGTEQLRAPHAKNLVVLTDTGAHPESSALGGQVSSQLDAGEAMDAA